MPTLDSSTYLDTLIALVVIYLLLSNAVVCVQELFTMFRRSRGNFLRAALEEVFKDPLNINLTTLVYEQPSLASREANGKGTPAYIAPRQFAESIVSAIAQRTHVFTYEGGDGPNPITVRESVPTSGTQPLLTLHQRYVQGVEALRYSDMKRLLRGFYEDTQHIDEVKIRIEQWFNYFMDRVSGKFKRESRARTIWCSIVVVLFLKVNFLAIADAVLNDSAARGHFVNVGITMSAQLGPTTPGAPQPAATDTAAAAAQVRAMLLQIQQTEASLRSRSIPIGWNVTAPASPENWKHLVLGMIASVVILSFGSPFWFDVLKRLVTIRNTALPPGSPSSSQK